jgi:capsular polysaccharide transport system permease protein
MNVENFYSAALAHDLEQAESRFSRWPFGARLWKYRWLALVVLLPTLLTAIYYGLIASDIYTSQSSFTIKSPGQKSSSTSTLANLIQTTGLSAGQEQSQEVLEYLRSRDAIVDLGPAVDLRKIYGNRGADFLSRFPQPLHDPSFEHLYKYYRNMVSADVDKDTNVAVLQVRAFTPEDAQRLNERLLNLSEALVNRLNERAEHRAIAETEQRVLRAQSRLRAARLAMGAYRNGQDIVDPSKQATGVLELTNQMTGQVTALKAQLELMERVTPRNPSIPALRNRIAAMERGLAAENGRAVGTRGGIASKIGEYENLMVEQELATQVLTAANASLEQARSEAQRQQFYLERVVEPNRPDDATLPNRLIKIITVAATSLCLYFIGWMFVVGILEHSPES